MTELFGLLATFAPLFLIMYLANVAERQREEGLPYQGTAFLAYAGTALMFFFGLFAGLAFQAFATAATQQAELVEEFFVAFGEGNPLDDFASPQLMALGLWLPSLIGLILLTPPVRRLAARFMPLDPDSPVHAVALSWSMFVVVNLMMTLGVGLGNLTEALQAEAESAAQGADITILTLWTQQLLMAALAFVGVGWLSRRNWSETLHRTGIVRPTGRQVLIGAGVGLAMVPAVMIAGGISTQLGFGPDPDVDALTEELLGPLFRSPWGILTLGLAAALGEETLFRGAVQPRFGIVATSLLFALVHSNYGITISTLVVFLFGLLLGYLRIRYNTTTTMVTHAVYNISLGLAATIAANFMDI